MQDDELRFIMLFMAALVAVSVFAREARLSLSEGEQESGEGRYKGTRSIDATSCWARGCCADGILP
jgi:hypothetical protein